MKFIKDGLFGLAIGEAFGVQLDMEDENLVSPVTTMQDNRAYECDKGTYSDDTCMFLACMDSYIRCKTINYKDIMDSLCDWINENKYSSTDYLFDISKTIRFSLMDYWKNKDYTSSGTSEEKRQDASCLSRVFLLNIIYSNKNITDKKLIEEISNLTKITHNSELSVLGMFIAYKFMKYIIDGNTPEKSLIMLKRYKYEKYFSKNIIDKYSRIINGNIKDLNISDINKDSSIISILESVFFILSNTNTYKDAIITSCMVGGSNGVRASITGLFAGLYYKEKSIPKEWSNILKRKDYLNKMSRKLNLVLSM